MFFEQKRLNSLAAGHCAVRAEHASGPSLKSDDLPLFEKKSMKNGRAIFHGMPIFAKEINLK
jgi:hypothetical protein